MENELYTLSLNLRAVAHVMNSIPDIADKVEDDDFMFAITEVFSDYLYAISDRMLEKLSCNFSDRGFNRRAVFGDDFSHELRKGFKNNSEGLQDE